MSILQEFFSKFTIFLGDITIFEPGYVVFLQKIRLWYEYSWLQELEFISAMRRKVLNMLKKTLIIGLAFGTMAAAQAVTIATHDDPALNASTPVFSTTASAVSASWMGTGLTLEVPVASLVFNDVKMEMASVNRVGNTLGPGAVKFYTSDANNPIFQVNFTSASVFEPFGVGGSFIAQQDVSFSGSAVDGMLFDNEQFAFSFANPVIGQNGNTYTASFTSSADVVPEPASMLILGLGAAALAKRKRK